MPITVPVIGILCLLSKSVKYAVWNLVGWWRIVEPAVDGRERCLRCRSWLGSRRDICCGYCGMRWIVGIPRYSPGWLVRCCHSWCILQFPTESVRSVGGDGEDGTMAVSNLVSIWLVVKDYLEAVARRGVMAERVGKPIWACFSLGHRRGRVIDRIPSWCPLWWRSCWARWWLQWCTSGPPYRVLYGRGGGLSELRCCGVSRVDECSGSGGLIVKHNRYAAMGCGVGVRRVSRWGAEVSVGGCAIL